MPADAEYFPEFASLKINPAEVPLPAFTGVFDGKPIGCAGVCTLRPGLGEAWIILARPVGSHGPWIARTTRRFLNGMIADQTFRRIQLTVRVGNIEAERFALWLGMRKEGVLVRFGDDGSDHYMYAKTKLRRPR